MKGLSDPKLEEEQKNVPGYHIWKREDLEYDTVEEYEDLIKGMIRILELAGIFSGAIGGAMLTVILFTPLNNYPVFSNVLNLAAIAFGAFVGVWRGCKEKEVSSERLVLGAILAIPAYIVVFYIVMLCVILIRTRNMVNL
jgi:hypothetical protein